MKLSCRLQTWFLAFTAWAFVSSVAAQNAQPEPIYYTLRSPRLGQLDPNHRNRLPWSGTISNVAELPNGRLLIAGSVYRPGHPGFTNLAVLDQFGRVETNAPRFLAEPPLAVKSQPDGSVAIVEAGGRKMQFLNAQLEPDQRFVWPPPAAKGARPVVGCLSVADDGSWLVGGYYESPAGQPYSRSPFVINLTSYGGAASRMAADFVPWNTNSGTVSLVRPAPDGKLLVCLTHASGRNLVRLSSDGLLDRSFSLSRNVAGSIVDLLVVPDGRIYVLLLNGYVSQSGLTPSNLLGRINPDGSVDQTFRTDFLLMAEILNAAKAFTVDHEGRILLAGIFRPRGMPDRRGLGAARFFPDGSWDRAFVAGESMTMTGLAEQTLIDRQGRIAVVGEFTVTDRIEPNDVEPSLVGTSGINFSSSGLAILHNADRALAAPPRLTNGVFSVESFLPASGYLILERSADMVHWQGFRTNFAAGTNWLRASFPVNEAEAGEFFRVSVRP